MYIDRLAAPKRYFTTNCKGKRNAGLISKHEYKFRRGALSFVHTPLLDIRHNASSSSDD